MIFVKEWGYNTVLLQYLLQHEYEYSTELFVNGSSEERSPSCNCCSCWTPFTPQLSGSARVPARRGTTVEYTRVRRTRGCVLSRISPQTPCECPLFQASRKDSPLPHNAPLCGFRGCTKQGGRLFWVFGCFIVPDARHPSSAVFAFLFYEMNSFTSSTDAKQIAFDGPARKRQGPIPR